MLESRSSSQDATASYCSRYYSIVIWRYSWKLLLWNKLLLFFTLVYNSRRKHCYAKVHVKNLESEMTPGPSTSSLASGWTENTFVELLPVSQMGEVDNDFSSTSSYYGKTANRGWTTQVIYRTYISVDDFFTMLLKLLINQSVNFVKSHKHLNSTLHWKANKNFYIILYYFLWKMIFLGFNWWRKLCLRWLFKRIIQL